MYCILHLTDSFVTICTCGALDAIYYWNNVLTSHQPQSPLVHTEDDCGHHERPCERGIQPPHKDARPLLPVALLCTVRPAAET
jgi:hypothetical protein